MVQFRNREKEILFKVVYYGPALGGKTTNLEVLHKITDPDGHTTLTSLKTAEDRTLFFDLLPFDLGEIQGYHIRVQVYTVPGQVHYNTTRKIVLSGADSIIFVADSQPAKMKDNYVSWENMKANLMANSMNLETIPVIIQGNKQDLAGAVGEETLLKGMQLKETFEVVLSSALTGEGVVETFKKAVVKSLVAFSDRFKLKQKGVTGEKLESSLDKFFEPFKERVLVEEDKKIPSLEATVPLVGMSEEEQLSAALKSTTEIAEQYNEVERLSNFLSSRLEEMKILHEIGLKSENINNPEDLAVVSLRALSGFKKNLSYTLFKLEKGGIKPILLIGHGADPLFQLGNTSVGNFAVGLIEKKEPERLDDLELRLEEVTGQIFPLPSSVISLFLGKKETPLYAIFAYSAVKTGLSSYDEKFLRLFQDMVSSKVAAAELFLEIKKCNDELERKVIERTAELSGTVEKLKELDEIKKAFLNSVSHQIITPLTNIKTRNDFLVRHPEMWPQKGREFLLDMGGSIEKLQSLISDLLSYNCIKEPITGENCNMGTVLENELFSFAGKLGEKKIKVSTQKEGEPVEYPINREDTALLMRQLLDNAIKYSPMNSQIKVFLINEEKRVIFSVRDYGPGFPKEKREFNHEPVSDKSPGAQAFVGDGLGMGLFFVREILSKYRGSMHIDDMNPGTNVLVELGRR
ncbi:MAG TPA: ATP-binding protein [Acidobacteriota bacterium]|nr:ATP-binding protein [Acidobacteriota bacterium]HQQ45856.1 ATP-binding protein [Acidobacteriota bacterium]